MIELIGFLLLAALVYGFYTANSKEIKKTTEEIEDLIK